VGLEAMVNSGDIGVFGGTFGRDEPVAFSLHLFFLFLFDIGEYDTDFVKFIGDGGWFV
jgi:hypothetical protein